MSHPARMSITRAGRARRWSTQSATTIVTPMSELSREQFIEQVLQTVAAKFPLVKIARGEQPFSMKVNGHVASLENLYRTGNPLVQAILKNWSAWEKGVPQA